MTINPRELRFSEAWKNRMERVTNPIIQKDFNMTRQKENIRKNKMMIKYGCINKT
jgi:hypothetical protein